MKKKETRPKRKGVSRMARTIQSLLLMAVLGVTLALVNIYSNGKEVSLATGPESPEQRRFFVDAAERPDMLIFFKSLKPDQRLKMSENIGRYDNPELAKLIAKLLETFDTSARKALTASMSKLAATRPKVVAEQLKVAGSFQQLAIQSALRQAGPRAYPLVAQMLTNVDARPNAVAYLVTSGSPAVPAILPMLDHKEKDVRLAAADAAGKLRAREALPKLTSLYEGAVGDEKYGYLAAIAGVGDKASEPLLEAAIKNESLPAPQRAQAALGLGRIATDSAIRLLWSYAGADNRQVQQSSISALQVAGDRALQVGLGTPRQRILVAEGIRSPEADRLLVQSLKNPELTTVSAQAGAGRTGLVPVLKDHLLKLDASRNGDVADALIASLATTPEGRRELQQLGNTPLSGLIDRRLALLSQS